MKQIEQAQSRQIYSVLWLSVLSSPSRTHHTSRRSRRACLPWIIAPARECNMHIPQQASSLLNLATGLCMYFFNLFSLITFRKLLNSSLPASHHWRFGSPTKFPCMWEIDMIWHHGCIHAPLLWLVGAMHILKWVRYHLW